MQLGELPATLTLTDAQAELLRYVLVHHARLDAGQCGCGYSKIGKSYSDHLVRMYQQAINGNDPHNTDDDPLSLLEDKVTDLEQRLGEAESLLALVAKRQGTSTTMAKTRDWRDL